MTKARTLADNFAADINGITAGTGISGGGTSGTVTVTNSMATAIDAKGDLVVGTGADTFGRLAVASTAGYLLAVDSTETTGLKWAAPAAASFVGCRLKRNSQQVVSNNTVTTIQFNAEDFDTDGFHDNSTNNSRVTIPSGKGGKYLFVGTAYADTGNIDKLGRWYGWLRKNGAGSINTTYIEFGGSANGYETWSIYSILDLVATDYIEWQVFQSTGVSANLDADYQSLSVQYLGA